MTSNFKQSLVNQEKEVVFEVVKVSGSWVFPAASSIVESTKGKNMYLRLTDDGKSDIFRLDYVKDGENAGETVFGFVGNGGMDLVELTATTDGTGVTTGSWDHEPGEGPAGEAIGNLGQPLQWKGPATVSELNTGISGIQPGWTYTLTDAGTLTDGSVVVDTGDEVAWTEDGKWFKLGGEGVAKVYTVAYDSETTTWNYPTYSQISTDVAAGKFVVLLVTSPAGAVYSYKLDDKTLGLDSSFRFSLFTKEVTRTISIKNDDTVTEGTIWNGSVENIAPDYSSLTFPIAEGTQCSHNGKYYYCSLSGGIQSSEPWTVLHWTQTSVADQIGSVGSDIEVVYVAAYDPNTSDLFDYLSDLFSAGKTAILRYSYAMYSSDYIVGYSLGFSPPGSLFDIKAFSNVYAGTVNILTINSSGYSFEQKYVGRLTELTDATESDLNNNAISMGDNVVRKLTLTTISTLTVNIGSVGNFALEIDNTGNSNDVTIDVQHGPDSLKYSVAGGNVVGAGKYMQLTCVGNCWTLAEFTAPTP